MPDERMVDSNRGVSASLADLVKEVMGLSSGILTVSVVFSGDITKRLHGGNTTVLQTAWASYIVSLVLGVFVLLLVVIAEDERFNSAHVRPIAVVVGLQVAAFTVATTLLGIAGIAAI